ncbi:MAG: hypothetical protein EPN55_07520 [Gammaproteobacteria bacterium]|nr:MAG: hypothetical protein EPN55_07520 [Gammaproteobacteria bacterium]
MTEQTEGATAPTHALLKNRDAVRAQLTLLANQARHEIRVFAPHLDPSLFNTGEITHLLASFVARDRHNLVHILVEDSEQTVRDNDRVVQLCQRMSDFVQLRRVSEQHIGLKEMFVVVDRLGYLHQQDLTRPECLSSSADAHGAAELLQRFREMWDRSEPVQRLHTTGL